MKINWRNMAALALFAAQLPEARRFHLFKHFWRPDWAAFRDILVLGLPIGLTTVAEIAMLAGLPQSIPGVTLNRLCASGMTAITTARAMIAAGRLPAQQILGRWAVADDAVSD